MMVASELRNVRHKTAMRRTSLSRPVSTAIRDRILRQGRKFFDYGCGYGTDVEILRASEYESHGWDPFYHPDYEKSEADIVNLGFVLNVIEDPNERVKVLKEAFELAQTCLVVSVRIDSAFFEDRFGDGAVTKDGTFQKIFTQAEFRSFVESVLEKKIYIIEPGIGYVFKDVLAEQEFVSGKYLNRLSTHDELIIKKIHEAVDADKVARLIEELGRVPRHDELTELAFLGKRQLRSFIESSVMPLVDSKKLESGRERIREDILQALAMTRIENHRFLPAKNFSPEFQQAVKEFFSNYRDACQLAEEMLFSLGKEKEVARIARKSEVGKLLPEDLYVHRSALEHVPGLLKLMLSLGESIVGRMDADLIKFSLHGRSMSFLFYRDFDSKEHPELSGSVRVDFRKAKYQVRDYSHSENPPILHRKETFVLPSYEQYEKFKSLTEQEELAGLLGESGIGFKRQWEELLAARGIAIQNHSLQSS